MELGVLAVALIVDVLFGEPPNAVHPVAWMGTLIARIRDLCPSRAARIEFLWGALMALVIPSACAVFVYWLLRAASAMPALLFVLSALTLKSVFALRALGQAAMNVKHALTTSRLADARAGLQSLCSRDPSKLEEPELVAATIESVAENASDSFVAPLFYYCLFGVPGAVFYRAVNTLDAMIGYHGRFEYLGKASARFDDLLNFIPARLTAGLLISAGAVLKLDVRSGVRVLLRDGRRTESPNAGRPMAAMAGLLRVQLAKPGHYVLGDALTTLNPSLIDRAWRAVALTGFLTWGAVSAWLWVRYG